MHSNASLSKFAKESTDKADAATDAVAGGGGSHAQAASAHRSAMYANQSAGNGTQAKKHEVAAALHDEKAKPQDAANQFADSLASHADSLSKKADMAHAAGSASLDPRNSSGANAGDTKDPRSAQELHQVAAKAHDKASKAYQIADCGDKQKYHEGKRDEHIEKSKNASSQHADAASSRSIFPGH